MCGVGGVCVWCVWRWKEGEGERGSKKDEANEALSISKNFYINCFARLLNCLFILSKSYNPEISHVDPVVVLCTHYPAYNSTDPDHWFCKPGNGCIALHSCISFNQFLTEATTKEVTKIVTKPVE